MSISLSHSIWVWFLAAFMLFTALNALTSLHVSELLIGIAALGTAVFLFVRVGQNEPPA